MAAITITTTTPQDGATFVYGTAGEAIAAGKAVVFSHLDNKFYLADADNLTRREIRGIAVCSCTAGAQVAVQTGGRVDVDASSTTKGTVYIAGATPGSIHPASDVGTGWELLIVGYGSGTNQILIAPQKTGIVV
jgi:hypothetical protein